MDYPITSSVTEIQDLPASFGGALMKEMKTELHFSTTFHPQSDGLAEVSNCTLEQLL